MPPCQSRLQPVDALTNNCLAASWPRVSPPFRLNCRCRPRSPPGSPSARPHGPVLCSAPVSFTARSTRAAEIDRRDRPVQPTAVLPNYLAYYYYRGSQPKSSLTAIVGFLCCTVLSVTASLCLIGPHLAALTSALGSAPPVGSSPPPPLLDNGRNVRDPAPAVTSASASPLDPRATATLQETRDSGL